MADSNELKIIIASQFIGEKEFNKVSKNIQSIAKSAEGMGKSMKDQTKKMTKGLDSISGEVRKMRNATENSTTDMENFLARLSHEFFYLSVVAGAATATLVNAMKEFVGAAAEAENAILGLQVEAIRYGESGDEATRITQELTETGLIRFNEAAEATRNLMATGLGLDKVEKMLWAMLDRSVVAREAQYNFGEAVLMSSRGIRSHKERLADALLIQGIFDKGTAQAARTLGKKESQVNDLEEAEGVYNVMMQESVAMAGLHETASDTLTATLNRLSTAVWELKRAFGEGLAPIIGSVADILTEITQKATQLVGAFGDLSGALLSATTGSLGMITAMTTLGGTATIVYRVAMSVVKGIKSMAVASGSLSAMLVVSGLTAGKLIAILGAIGAAIGIAVYAFSKLSGRAERHRDVTSKLNDELLELKQRIHGVNEEVGDDAPDEAAMRRLEDRKRKHQRTVDDIKEQMEEEVSKGLWADKQRVKDLRKRLAREEEDFALFMRRWNDDYEKSQEKDTDTAQTELEYRLGLMAEMMKEEREKIEQEWGQAGDKFWQAFWDSMLDPVTWKNFFIDLGRKIKKIWDLLWDNEWRIEALKKVGEGFAAVAQVIFDVFSLIYKAIKTVFSGLWLAIKDPIQDTIIWIRDKLNQFIALVNRQITVIRSLPGMGWIPTIREMGALPWEKPGEREARMLQEIHRATTTPGPGGIGTLPIDYAGSTAPVYSYQQGTDFVPRTDWYQLHKGEAVIPARENREKSWGDTIININNPVVRNDEDIQLIADAVSKAISQKQRWAKLGAY